MQEIWISRGEIKSNQGHHQSFPPLTGVRMEYLAATGPMGVTPVPGETSFTSALIYAMEALLEEKSQGRFTTVELLKKIMDDAPKFPKDTQTPLLSNRNTDDLSTSRIMLHPLQKDGSEANTPSKDITKFGPAKQWTLTLHFDFNEIPSSENVKKLGLELNNINETYALGVNRVHWGGMQPKAKRAWFSLLDNLGRKKRQRTLSTAGDYETSPIVSNLAATPPTPASTMQNTPKKPGSGDLGDIFSNFSGMEAESCEQSWDNDSNAESERRTRSRRKRPKLSLTPAK